MVAPLIGVIGYAQSGKDTFAAYTGFHKMAFADSLRELALESNPAFGEWTLQQHVEKHGWDWCKVHVQGVREYLQNLGVGSRLVFGPDIWVETLARKWDDGVATVIPDIRFMNELRFVQAVGGLVVRIRRESHAAVNGHVSEKLAEHIDPAELDYDINIPEGDFGSIRYYAAEIGTYALDRMK